MATEMLVDERADSITAADLAKLRPARVLSWMVAGMAAALSIAGLAFPSLYGRANWGAMSVGNDLVTLVAAVPVLVVSLVLSWRGPGGESGRAHLVWLGALYYMTYNYAFYVFALPVTRLFVPLIAVCTLSGFALALAMGNSNAKAIATSFSPRAPVKAIAIYMWYVGVMVGFLWVSQWVRFVLTGNVPDVNGDQHGYTAIAAVDLMLMVSLLFPAAWWLWRRRPWGYLLGVMMNVQGALYTAVMAAVCVTGWIMPPHTPLWSAWFISCIVSCPLSALCACTLLVNVRAAQARPGLAVG